MHFLKNSPFFINSLILKSAFLKLVQYIDTVTEKFRPLESKEALTDSDNDCENITLRVNNSDYDGENESNKKGTIFKVVDLTEAKKKCVDKIFE